MRRIAHARVACYYSTRPNKNRGGPTKNLYLAGFWRDLVKLLRSMRSDFTSSAMNRKSLSLKAKGVSKKRGARSKQVRLRGVWCNTIPPGEEGAKIICEILVFSTYSHHGKHQSILTLEARYIHYTYYNSPTIHIHIVTSLIRTLLGQIKVS